jgi:hypothetical protein
MGCRADDDDDDDDGGHGGGGGGGGRDDDDKNTISNINKHKIDQNSPQISKYSE